MALFKPFRGSRASLDAQPLHDGYAYFCTDDGSFHIDYVDTDGNLQRKQISAKDAETLTGASLSTILNSSDIEIPTSKAVLDALTEAVKDLATEEYVETFALNNQADWSVNDETSATYIQNRPFYVDAVESTSTLTIEEQSSGGGTSEDNIFAKLLYENYENCVYEVFNGGAWVVGSIESVETIDECLSIEISCLLESGNTLGHTVKIANDYSYINWIRATEHAGTKIRFIVTTTEEVVNKIDPKYLPNGGQSDWLVNDEASPAYVRNKPFGDVITATDISGVTYTIGEFTSGTLTVEHDAIPLEIGQVWSVQGTNDANPKTVSVQVNDSGELYLGTPTVNEMPFYIRATETTLNSSYWYQMQPSHLTLTCVSGVATTASVKQLDQKYIPNADWNVNDENADGYIKNRTHYDNSVVICDWDGDVSKIDDIVYVDDAPAMYRIGDCLTYTAAEVQELYETVEPKIVVSSINNYEFQYIDIMPADAEGGYGVDIYGFTGIDDAGNGATPVCLNILSDNFALEALNVVIPKKGMWLIPTSDFTVLRFYFENIKTLDPKFLPNNGQSDWNQNDETAADYIKNRPFYPMDESYIGSLNFTATGTNTMEYTYANVDDVVLFYFQKLAGKGQVIKAKVNGCGGLIGVEFSRGYFSISGAMTGHFMFSPGRVWESTVSMNGISLTSDEVYQVEFYDTTTPGYMPLDIKYLSSKVHTDERAPIQYGTGDGSTIQNGAKESSGRESHAQGNNTVARGWSAHAQGAYTEANGDHTQAEGYYTIANGTNQHVQGKFNIADDDDKYAHIVGNGTNGNARSNAHTLDWYGNAWFAGDIKVGGTGQDDSEAKTLVTTEYAQPKDVVVTLLDDGTIDIPVNDLVAEYDNGSRIVVKSQRYGQFNSVTSKDINLIILTNTRIVGDNEVEVDELELRYDFRNDVNTWRHTAKLIEEPSIVQTTGDSTTALMSQKAITDLLPKFTTVTMLAADWSGDANPWSQVVSVNGVTANSKVDLQPTAIQIVELQNDEITLMLQNDNGIITAWAIGNKPTEDYTMDVLITEVVRV